MPQMSENGSVSSSVTTEGSVTSGTATDAMIAAATAASSAEASPTGTEAATVAQPAGNAGDTSHAAGASDPGATAGAIAKPDVTGQGGDTKPNRGPVPLDRHEASVKNAREEGIKQGEAKYAWAKGHTPESVGAAFEVAHELASDPKAFAIKLCEELGLKLAGSADAGKPQTTDVSSIKPELTSEDGRAAYSAEQVQQILDIRLSQMRDEMKPLMEDRLKAQRIEGEQRMRQESQARATEALTEARKLPHFTKENEPVILQNLMNIPVEVKRKIGPVAALYQAYNQFLGEKVFPTINQTAEQNVRESNGKKAAASIGAHPVGGDGQVTKVEIPNANSLARHMEKLAETMTA